MATNVTAAMTMPAIAPLLNPPPDAALLVVALAVALEVVEVVDVFEVESLEFGPPPSGGGDWPGVNI